MSQLKQQYNKLIADVEKFWFTKKQDKTKEGRIIFNIQRQMIPKILGIKYDINDKTLIPYLNKLDGRPILIAIPECASKTIKTIKKVNMTNEDTINLIKQAEYLFNEATEAMSTRSDVNWNDLNVMMNSIGRQCFTVIPAPNKPDFHVKGLYDVHIRFLHNSLSRSYGIDRNGKLRSPDAVTSSTSTDIRKKPLFSNVENVSLHKRVVTNEKFMPLPKFLSSLSNEDSDDLWETARRQQSGALSGDETDKYTTPQQTRYAGNYIHFLRRRVKPKYSRQIVEERKKIRDDSNMYDPPSKKEMRGTQRRFKYTFKEIPDETLFGDFGKPIRALLIGQSGEGKTFRIIQFLAKRFKEVEGGRKRFVVIYISQTLDRDDTWIKHGGWKKYVDHVFEHITPQLGPTIYKIIAKADKEKKKPIIVFDDKGYMLTNNSGHNIDFIRDIASSNRHYKTDLIISYQRPQNLIGDMLSSYEHVLLFRMDSGNDVQNAVNKFLSDLGSKSRRLQIYKENVIKKHDALFINKCGDFKEFARLRRGEPTVEVNIPEYEELKRISRAT